MKALTSEVKLQLKPWYVTIPLVQAALNDMSSDRLGGISPVTAFTGGRYTVVGCGAAESASDGCAGLDTIHQQVTTISERRNVQARGRHAAKTGVRMAKFSIGDLVLEATVIKGGSKLSLHWRDLKRVVRSLNDYTFEVQDICAPYTVTVRHASRLKFYREAGRGVTEDLIAHALHGEGVTSLTSS
ncbi:Hypothetical protein PHPALM_18036 [Phytophthora palmivora]|uniref:Uncharacterized protein n=1 Tax=Phytophthora palmivora TaxID=4796 RepID=A0A2P4XKR5_9STRA|nr:Hypothetical protein PHPALM_18036 [Phytophthora palmivora]